MADRIRERFPALAKAALEGVGLNGVAASSRSLDSPALSQVGDYRILREVGRGGMGVVYEAEQLSLGRRVALKVLPPQIARDRTAIERFRREAKAAARLHHTNIVPVFEVGRDGDVAFYAMQFIEGLGLDQVINELRSLRSPNGQVVSEKTDREKFPGTTASAHGVSDGAGGRRDCCHACRVADLLMTGKLATDGEDVQKERMAAPSGLDDTQRLVGDPTLRAIPSALGLDHSAAPVLPDISSSAVLPGGTDVSGAGRRGRGELFFRSVAQIGRQTAQGLAYAHARGVVHRDIKPSNLLLDTAGIVWITDFGLAKTEDDGLTAPGDILGTIRYMAPERFRGEGETRADIYALGMTLYELLTTQPAFDTSDRLRLIELIKTAEPARPRALDATIPRDLETIVLKAIDKDPDRRYQTSRALAEDLRRFLADEPILARRVSQTERYWRWARRNPLTATLGGVLTGVLLLATLGSLLAARTFHSQALNQHTLASNEADARRKTEQANLSLLDIQEALRRTIYATRSNLALAAWDAGNVSLTNRLLGLMKPSPGEPDLRGWEWRYLWQLGHEHRLTLRARDEERLIGTVTFSRDGRSIAALERGGRIHLWDRQTGNSHRVIGLVSSPTDSGLAQGVSTLAYSPDGRTIAGPGPDASLALYSVETGEVTKQLEGPHGAVLGLAWSPDGWTLIASLSSHVMRAWDTRDGHLIHKHFGGHLGPVAGVAYSPDGRTVASASYDRTVKLWDAENPREPRAVLNGHTDEVRSVAFSPDGQQVASAGLDGTLRLWDANSGAALAVIRGHTSAVTSLAYMPDGKRIVTASHDETVRVWDTASIQGPRVFKATDALTSVAVSPDGRDIAAAGDVTVRVWDASSPPRPLTLQSPSLKTYGGGVECLAFSPDGTRLVSGHDDHALRVWELPSGRPLHVIQGHTETIKCVAFSTDGRTIASAGADKTVRLWDAATGALKSTFTGHDDHTSAVVFLPDGKTIVSTGADMTIRAWDMETGTVHYVLRGHTDMIHDLALSPDGRTLASASYDSTCILWDLEERKPLSTLRGHTDRINTVAFSPDGKSLATSSYDETVRLWDAHDGSPRGVLEGHIEGVDGLAFSTDGRLASSADDRTIRVWDPTSKQTLLVLKGHSGRIRCIKFSPDGRTLASASYDRTLKLWEAAPETALARQ